jgi:hypothetical protein
MNDIEFYTELIEKIATLKKENIELRIKLGDCEGQLKILNRFYSDFKHPNRNEVILNDTILSGKTDSDIANTIKTSDSDIPNTTTDIIKTAPEYDILLGQYFINKNADILKRLFEDFGVHPAQILTDIRNEPPDNIIDLVKQYKCKNEYNIILKSIRNIKRFTKATHFVERDIMDLVNSYINYYNRGDKEGALKFLKQTLVYFPFQIYKFLDNITQYKYSDLDEYIENLKVELYGKNNILLVNRNNKVKKNKDEAGLINNKIKKKRTNIKIDYLNVSVSELSEIIKNIKNNPRQRAFQIYDKLVEFKRSENDCLLFLEEIDKLLPLKKVKNHE